MVSKSRPRLTLRRDQRLHGARHFAELKSAGHRRVCGSFIMNWCPSPEGERTKLGVVTSRKVGGAVTRSRARRLLREAFRQEQNRLREPIRLVLVARRSLPDQSLASVIRALQRGLREAGLLADPQRHIHSCESSC